jgi:mannose-6-phosphate isomerase-like protein (cupin superfamily)
MDPSRRDLSLLLPLLAAARASAQSAAAMSALPTKAYAYDELPVKTSGVNKSRAVLKGGTHSGFPIELHMTELGPHAAPHPPHKHVHEELVMIRTGTLEVTMLGRTANYGPGSIIYIASGDEHGWKNATAEHAEYFVIALGSDT